MHIQFEALEKLIVVSGPQVAVVNAKTGDTIKAIDLKAEMEITMVYLDSSEREMFSQKHLSS